MSGIIRLLRLFPFNGVTPALMDEYNQQSITEVEKSATLLFCITTRQNAATARFGIIAAPCLSQTHWRTGLNYLKRALMPFRPVTKCSGWNPGAMSCWGNG